MKSRKQLISRRK